MIRVVIDTNVALSGLLWRGEPGNLLSRAGSGEFLILSTSAMIDELTRIIYLDKFKKRFEELKSTPEEPLIFYQNLVRFCKHPPKLKIKCDDPDDYIFAELAVAESAHFIVSGDSHLLNLRAVCDIPILTPRQSHQLLDKISHKRKSLYT